MILDHLKKLKKGSIIWNRWRQLDEDLAIDLSNADLVNINLSGVNLSGVNLSKANLSGANLFGADLKGANLSEANLNEVDLSKANLGFANFQLAKLNKANLNSTLLMYANLSQCDLHQASFIGADLQSANLSLVDLTTVNFISANLSGVDLTRSLLRAVNLSGANLMQAVLSHADLSYADLSHADLSSARVICADFNNSDLNNADLSEAYFRGTNFYAANLSLTRMLSSDFTQANFTGACIDDWHINSSTCLDNVKCDYVFRKIIDGNFLKRLPIAANTIFGPQEFTKRFQIFESALETIDLTFTRGIDWQAFFQTLQEAQISYPLSEISVQAIERKKNSFVVRLEVEKDSNKAELEQKIKEIYQQKFSLLEQHYRVQLDASKKEVEMYREQSANMLEITKLLANKSIIFGVSPVTENNQLKQEFHNSTGNFTGFNQGGQKAVFHNYASNQHKNLAEAAKEIQELLEQLSKTYPITDVPGKAVEEIQQNPQLKNRVIGALKAGAKKALEELVKHPATSIVLAAIEGADNPC